MCFGQPAASFPYSDGDRVDLLFNLDINEYQGVKSVQLIVRDIHPAEGYSGEMSRAAQRYEEVRAGGSYTPEEDFCPDRDDFAQVYTTIRRECRIGHDRFTLRMLGAAVNQTGPRRINPVKLKFIVRILQEMQVLGVEELASDRYQFSITFNAAKINLEKSSILRHLRTQCTDRTK